MGNYQGLPSTLALALTDNKVPEQRLLIPTSSDRCSSLEKTSGRAMRVQTEEALLREVFSGTSETFQEPACAVLFLTLRAKVIHTSILSASTLGICLLGRDRYSARLP